MSAWLSAGFMILLALLFAVALNDTKLWGRSFFRTAIFLPCVTSLVAYAILFKSMFGAEGVVNIVLTAIGVGPKPWLTDPFWAKVFIFLAITWRWTGYNMIFYLAALQNVDRAIYEVSRIDGVPPWARFWYITLPMLKQNILVCVLLATDHVLGNAIDFRLMGVPTAQLLAWVTRFHRGGV